MFIQKMGERGSFKFTSPHGDGNCTAYHTPLAAAKAVLNSLPLTGMETTCNSHELRRFFEEF